MKIEKVNDHQIRCTLTKEDLADREIKLSELAYGTEKAKDLFRDMIQQASFEFGFEAEDIPLMIEAIPLNSDCIVLIITKVEDPDELDTRFAKFAPSVRDDSDSDDTVSDTSGIGADDILDLFKKIASAHAASSSDDSFEESAIEDSSYEKTSGKKARKRKLADLNPNLQLVRAYGFGSLHELFELSQFLVKIYNGSNTLYKDTDGRYILTLSKSDHTPEEFNKVCNILSEYAVTLRNTPGYTAYLEEHMEVIIEDNAIQSLAKV